MHIFSMVLAWICTTVSEICTPTGYPENSISPTPPIRKVTVNKIFEQIYIDCYQMYKSYIVIFRGNIFLLFIISKHLGFNK